MHTHLIHADLFGYAAAKLARVSAVVSSRHLDDAFRYHARWRRVNRWLWRRIDAGIAISDAMEAIRAGDFEDAPADKISVVLYGMEYRWRSDEDIAASRKQLRAELKPAAGCASAGNGLPPGGAERHSLCAGGAAPHSFGLPARPSGDRGRWRESRELRRLASMLGIADRVHAGWAGARTRLI